MGKLTDWIFKKVLIPLMPNSEQLLEDYEWRKEVHGDLDFGLKEFKNATDKGVLNQVIEEKHNPDTFVGAITEDLGLIPETKPEQEQSQKIKDETMSGIENSVSGVDYDAWKQWAEEQQAKQWEREDALRKETQLREDSAYTRAAADMRRAGINPNLTGVNAAQTGGGITSATGISENAWTAQVEEALKLLEQEIDNNFKEDENTKDRVTDIIGKTFQTILTAILFKK